MNMFLYSTELGLVLYAYFHLRLHRFHRYILACSLLTDTACTTVLCYDAWLTLKLATLPGVHPWTLGVSIMFTYIASALEQSFFAHRYWIITRNKYILGLIFLGIVVHIIFGFIAAIYVLVIPDFSKLTFGVPASAVAATVCAATDLLIAVAMFYKIRGIETVNTTTQSLLFRMSLLAIASGVFTATATTLMIVFLFTNVNA
ncbi:hypothetical protein V5O48_018319, partial [Marasmius crinis-equi]